MEFIFKVNKDGLTGEVSYKLPTAMERLQVSKHVNYDFIDGDIKEIHYADKAYRMIEKCKEYVTSVNCKTEDGFEFKDFDTLSMDSRGSEVIGEIANRIIGGSVLGKP